MFRLALALGKTVSELNRQLSPDELAEWEAYHFFEPFGSPAEDDRTRLLLEMEWYKRTEKEAPHFLDRDPEETARLEAKRAAAITLEARIAAAFAGFNVIEDDTSH